MTIATLAATFAALFVTDKRDNGDEFVRLGAAPQWAEEIVRAAHDEMFPDDTKYQMIRSVAWRLAERLEFDPQTDLDDVKYEILDGAIPIYNTERTAWLASHLDRAWYVDEAMKEGAAEANDLWQLLAAGIERELSEIWDAIVSGLAEEAEEEKEAEEVPG